MGGVIKDINYYKEVQMNAFVKGEHFILAPHFSTFITKQKDKGIEDKDILSIMIKVPDEGKGSIKNGIVKKKIPSKIYNILQKVVE